MSRRLWKYRITDKKLDPANPRQYNDVCIALLARQIGATVVTRDINDFKKIKRVFDFRFRDIIHA
jgi:predicted nucleic acid-binding protein